MEIIVNIGALITIVGFLLFLMRRIDNLRVEIKSDMLRMETRMDKMEAGIRSDMKDMKDELKTDIEKSEAGIRSDMKGMEARMEKMEAGIRVDMEKSETGIRSDMKDMEVRMTAEMSLKHGEVREDLRDIRVGLVEVRERQARLEGIVEGMGRAAEREPVEAGD